MNVDASFAVKANVAVALCVTFAGMADSRVVGGVVSAGIPAPAGAVAPAGGVVNERPGNQATTRSRSPLTPSCHR